MPEGPSLVILKEEVQQFINKKVVLATGNTKAFDASLMNNKKILDFKTWGKHFLICFNTFTIRIHFMLFGSYRINEQKDAIPRLSLKFAKGELNFYACSVKKIEEDLDSLYDWRADVMSDLWDKKLARQKLKQQPEMLACDALLDQNIFAGVGNIIKNEVLFRIKVHPLSKVGALPLKKLNQLIEEARKYSFDFLKWKKAYVLKKHWLAHRKKMCPEDNIPYMISHLGKTHRKSYYCEVCQVLYA